MAVSAAVARRASVRPGSTRLARSNGIDHIPVTHLPERKELVADYNVDMLMLDG